jgi:hypothetical protein
MTKGRDPYQRDLFAPPRQRRRLKPYFDAGQRVICVDASPNRLAHGYKPPVAGKIYVIRAIDMEGGWKFPWWGVHLEGIFIFHPGGYGHTLGRKAREMATDVRAGIHIRLSGVCRLHEYCRVCPLRLSPPLILTQ